MCDHSCSRKNDWKHSLDVALFFLSVLFGCVALNVLVGTAGKAAFIYRALQYGGLVSP